MQLMCLYISVCMYMCAFIVQNGKKDEKVAY